MLKRSARAHTGFTLVELMVVVAILAVLLSLGVSTYRDWAARTKIRVMTESIVSGLVLARNQAIQRNQQVRFSLTNGLTAACALNAAGTDWVVSMDSPGGQCNATPSDTAAPRIIQTRSGGEAGKTATVSAVNVDNTAASWVVFTGLGRGIIADATGAKPISTINISYPDAGTCKSAGGEVRCLRIQITAGGESRICDPAVTAAADPRTC